MNLDIAPEPSAAERAAIEAALAEEQEEQEQARASRWVNTVAPVHDGHGEPHP